MKIKCLKCNDIIQSLSVHDYRQCKCGASFIDGGNEYTRIGGDFEFICIVNEDGTEDKIDKRCKVIDTLAVREKQINKNSKL